MEKKKEKIRRKFKVEVGSRFEFESGSDFGDSDDMY